MVDVSAIGSFAMNIVVTVGSILIIGAILVAVFYFWRKKQKWSQYKVRVWGEDGFGQLKETLDKGGIFVDPKTKNKMFFLKRANVGLNPDKVPVIYTGKEKIVYVRKSGLKNFSFIYPTLTESNEVLKVGEEDVNWAINAFEREKKKFLNDKFMQYLPFIALGFVSVVILIIFIWFFKQFDVLKEVAQALLEASKVLAQPDVIR